MYASGDDARCNVAMRRIVAAAGCALLALGSPLARAQRLTIVSSGDSPAFASAIAGMRNHAGWILDVVRVGDDDAALAATLAAPMPDTAIVALGSRAAQFIGRMPLAVPAVDCMVQGDLPAATPLPVVPLAVPVNVQIKWMRQLIPAARKVALLFDPAQNARTAADVAQQLTAAGYAVMSQPVPSPEALPPALARLGDADALLALPDTTVYSPALAKGLLLFTYRTDTPMIAFTDGWVRAGALYGLEWDYGELGVYCAELALHLASTSKAAAAPVMPAPHVSVNRRAAAQLRLKWDAASLAGVDHVHD